MCIALVTSAVSELDPGFDVQRAAIGHRANALAKCLERIGKSAEKGTRVVEIHPGVAGAEPYRR